MGIIKNLIQKLNPSQPQIAAQQGSQGPLTPSLPYERAYERLEVVNRGVNMIVDAASQINIDVGDKEAFPGIATIRHKKLVTLLNRNPNPYQSADAFKRNIFLDMIMDGNAFMYYDGASLYHLPAENVTITPDKKTFIKGYDYNGTKYKPDEIIHIQDNSSDSIYRGKSRLSASKRSINLLYDMKDFQMNFFKNGAVPGLVLKTPNTLSAKGLQAELDEKARYYSTLVNGGVLTPNEARDALRLEKIEGHDDIRIPANIAGSASNPSEGGRPQGNEENDE
jgi:phage portal protein BeeE